MTLRACFVDRSLAYGGAQRVYVEQARALGLRGGTLDFLLTKSRDTPDHVADLRAAHPGLRDVREVRTTTGLSWALARGTYDLVLLTLGRNTWRALRRLRWAPWVRRPAVVLTLHEHYADLRDALAPFHPREAHAVVLAHDFRDVVSRYLGVPPGRLHVARPLFPGLLLRREAATDAAAADLRASWGAGQRSVVIGYLGRIAPTKGLVEVVGMAERLAASGRDVHLVLAGRPRRFYADYARALADRLPGGGRPSATLSGRLHVPGAVSDAAAHYAAFDLTVLCSSREGYFPLMLVESMSVGTPVLATAVGGIASCLRDGVDAALVEKVPDDASGLTPAQSAAFEARLRTLVDDAAVRARLGEAGRERVRDLVARADFAGEFLAAVDAALAERAR